MDEMVFLPLLSITPNHYWHIKNSNLWKYSITF